jgi:hypothetical protein
MRLDAKDVWRSSQSGRRENANAQKENPAQPFHSPTQAKTRLEWATRQPTGKAAIFDANNQFVSAWDLSADQVKGVVVNGKLW